MSKLSFAMFLVHIFIFLMGFTFGRVMESVELNWCMFILTVLCYLWFKHLHSIGFFTPENLNDDEDDSDENSN